MKVRGSGILGAAIMVMLIVALIVTPIPESHLGTYAPILTPGLGILFALFGIGMCLALAFLPKSSDKVCEGLCVAAAVVCGFIAICALLDSLLSL